jgi:Family of unknown function (DUF5372)
VRVIRPRHPLEGQALALLGWSHLQGQLHLLLVLPDGSRSLIPAAWTDLRTAPIEPRPQPPAHAQQSPPSASCSIPARLLSLFCVGVEPRTKGFPTLAGRNGRVEQLSLLESLRPNRNAAVGNTLNDKQKTAAITTLVRLIVQVVIGAHAEQEHQHE